MPFNRTYHSVVLVKQVPDTRNVTGEVMTAEGTMNRSALPAIFNPEDLNALEMALSIKEQNGGSVTVLTMGPMQAAEVLREALFRGADRVVLLSDRKFAGADTQATSYTLKCAIDKLGDYDLVFCGGRRSMGTPPRLGRRWPKNWASRRSPMPSRSLTCKGMKSWCGGRLTWGPSW